MKLLLPAIVAALVTVVAAGEVGENRLLKRIEKLEEQIDKLTEELQRLRAIEHPKVRKPQADELIIDVTAEGRIAVEGKELDDAEFLARMRKIMQLRPDQSIRIRGAADTKYRDIVRVIELCREAGIPGISFDATRIRLNKTVELSLRHSSCCAASLRRHPLRLWSA